MPKRNFVLGNKYSNVEQHLQARQRRKGSGITTEREGLPFFVAQPSFAYF